MPDHEWQNYYLDQEINDRGIMLDMEFVREAIDLDTRSRSDLITAMRELTGLENPKLSNPAEELACRTRCQN